MNRIKKDHIIKAAVTAFLTMVTTTSAFSADTMESSSSSTEKCYGISKAGMNDCSTATSSCASSSTKDGQTDAFILLPKGLCDRLVGGKLTSDVKTTK